MNNISISRILKLIKFEFLMHRKYYLTILIGALVLVSVVILIAWMQTRHLLTGWQQKHYQVVYFVYFLAVIIFIVGQGFKDLVTKASSERYLLLPASHIEKLIAQILTKFSVALIAMPFVFWFGVLLARLIGFSLMNNILSTKNFEKIEYLRFESLWILTEGEHWSFNAFFIGSVFFLFSFMILGSQYFGKWNFVYTPLIKILFVLITVLSCRALLSFYTKNNTNINELEVFDGVPLFVFVLIILLFLGSFLSYFISYHKLKEREV
ncbi:hypothetical protein MM236_16820 [Belliella sp. DSM 107340]|uniref:ABC transporter permease n=1 Tax=Belliella calami TaxID=2923436 RepID=A0ABS9USR3_9BACT|nr:hypothetical protein [Belliella calami]MCH7399663.1 hypothetical protein [Belliella calami]